MLLFPSPLLLFQAVPGTAIGANHTGRIYSLPDETTVKSAAPVLFFGFILFFGWRGKLLPDDKSFIRTNQCLLKNFFIKRYFFKDYVSGGELFTHLYQREKFKENEVRIYIAEIVVALQHLHKVSKTIFGISNHCVIIV